MHKTELDDDESPLWFAATSNFLGGGEIFISGIIVRATWAPFRRGMQSGYMRMGEIRMMLIIQKVTRKNV